MTTPTDPGEGFEERFREAEHEIRSLREVFSERRISLATMDRPLRLATGGALASLLAVVLLIALRDVGAASVDVGRSNGVVVAVSLPLFVTTLVLLALGFAYLLTGVTLAPWPIAASGLVLLTGAIGIETGSFGHLYGAVAFLNILPTWAQWGSRALLVALWLVAGAAKLLERRGASTQYLRLAVLVCYALLLGGYFTLLAVTTPSVGGLDLFPQVVSLLMTDIVLLVYPVLLVAAVDFGEWGGLSGERIASALRRGSRGALPLFAFLSCAGLAAFGYANLLTKDALLSSARLRRAGESLLLLGIALAVLVGVGLWLRVHRRKWPATLNFASIFAVAALGPYVLSPLSGLLAGSFHHAPRPEQVTEAGYFTGAADVLSRSGGTDGAAYTLLIPRGWVHGTAANGLQTWTDYALPGARPGSPTTPIVRVAVFTGQLTITDPHQLTGIKGADPATARRDGPWSAIDLRTGALTGTMWIRQAPRAFNTSYLLEGLVRGVPVGSVRPELEAIAHSFRTAGQPPATLPPLPEETSSGTAQRRTDRIITYSLAGVGALAIALLIGYAAAGRRWPARPASTVLLLGVFAVATLLFFGNSVGRVLAGPRTHWPYLSQYGLLTAGGVYGCVAVLAAMRLPARRRQRLLVALAGLSATVWALEGMSVVYQHALSASRVSIWAAITLLIAMGWDITLSGESFTNHGGRHAPRATRVLCFLGYVLLLAATVLFYSAQKAVTTGAGTEAFFEPEAVTMAGLFRLGLPVALLLFLLRLGSGRDDDREPPPQPADGGPDAGRMPVAAEPAGSRS
jgi:hypothetical protein